MANERRFAASRRCVGIERKLSGAEFAGNRWMLDFHSIRPCFRGPIGPAHILGISEQGCSECRGHFGGFPREGASRRRQIAAIVRHATFGAGIFATSPSCHGNPAPRGNCVAIISVWESALNWSDPIAARQRVICRSGARRIQGAHSGRPPRPGGDVTFDIAPHLQKLFLESNASAAGDTGRWQVSSSASFDLRRSDLAP